MVSKLSKQLNPFCSIIIPCGRGQVPKGIFEQNYPKNKIEIILVSHLAFKVPLGARIIKTKRLYYPGKMRNIGAKFAKGKYLLFLDDDCEPASNWTRTNIQALSNKEIGAVSGMISSKNGNFWEQVYDFSDFDLCQTKKSCFRILCSASFGIRKELFDSLGGFDESLRVVEDNDLCLRLQKMGYKTFYDPNIKIIHHHKKDSPSKILKHMFFSGYNANFILARRYPSLSFASRLLKFTNPFFHAILVMPLSVLNTLSCLKRNFKEHPETILFLPFIFLAKTALHLGILKALFKND